MFEWIAFEAPNQDLLLRLTLNLQAVLCRKCLELLHSSSGGATAGGVGSEDVDQEQADDHHDRESHAMDREGCLLRTA